MTQRCLVQGQAHRRNLDRGQARRKAAHRDRTALRRCLVDALCCARRPDAIFRAERGGDETFCTGLLSACHLRSSSEQFPSNGRIASHNCAPSRRATTVSSARPFEMPNQISTRRASYESNRLQSVTVSSLQSVPRTVSARKQKEAAPALQLH